MGTQDAPEQANCVGKTDLFFSSDPVDRRKAKALCLGCPRREYCLQQAAKDGPFTGSGEGVWLGMTARELHDAVDAHRARTRAARPRTPVAGVVSVMRDATSGTDR